MDRKTFKGLCVFALAVVGTLAIVATAPSITPDEVAKAFGSAHAAAATEAEPTVEPAMAIEYNFSDDEGLVIESCAPPACSEVSFNETEEEAIVVPRPRRAELAHR